MQFSTLFKHTLAASSLILASTSAFAGNWQYQVTITNLTSGQSFTPVFVASVKDGNTLFNYGKQASSSLVSLAEGGDSAPLAAELETNSAVLDTASGTGLVEPGQSARFTVDANRRFGSLILGAMMLPTNDGFIAINGLDLPKGNKTKTLWLNALDAGSETNDELCATIPGPTCGGTAFSPSDFGEGFVHVHDGIHGIGDLSPAMYDWRNPVAKVVVKRIK